MNSKEKIKNIKSVINEFYHTEKCEGRLTECANDCWKSYQKDCDEIKQDLDRLEQLEKENQELKEAITILKEVSSLNCDKTLETERHFLRLTQKEYELLKEVFENDR